MGSSRAPKRLLVLRTPFTTARTFPWRSVSRLTIRSDSPRRHVRSTIPWSRYRPTVNYKLRLPAPRSGGHCVRRYADRQASSFETAEAAVTTLELPHRLE